MKTRARCRNTSSSPASRIGKEIVHQAIEARARERHFLAGLAWDGEPRLHGWLRTYLGADHSPYTGTVGIMFLLAMVARVMKPGCKADYVIVLEGGQGTWWR